MEKTVVFVNGYYSKWKSGLPGWIARNYIGQTGGREYWSESFIDRMMDVFTIKTGHKLFIDGRSFANSKAWQRMKQGYAYGVEHIAEFVGKFHVFVTHSQGAAFAEGVLSSLKEHDCKVDKVLHLSPSQPDKINATFPEDTFHLVYRNDILSASCPINNISRFGIAAVKGQSIFKEFRYNHARTKFDPKVANILHALVYEYDIPEQMKTTFVKLVKD